MARPLRIEFADVLYDVMSRGNERCRIVRADAKLHRTVTKLEQELGCAYA